MKSEVGVWIDYRQAVVVIVPELNPEKAIQPVKSGLAKPVHYSGALTIGTAAPLYTTTGRGQDSSYDDRVNDYLDEVIFYVRDATAILILGPGATKFALQKRLEAQKLGEGIVAIKRAERMSHGQIALAVRQYFGEVRRQITPAVQSEPLDNGQARTTWTVDESNQLHFSAEEVQVRLAENRPVTVSARG